MFTINKQPEALRLVDELVASSQNLRIRYGSQAGSLQSDAATELRRQHELIVELVGALKQSLDECIWPNARLSDVHEKASTAISKAEAQQ